MGKVHLCFYACSWGILFSHPADFTPVCTTELARVVSLAPEFERRGVKMIALSIDSVQDHNAWIKDIQAYRDSSDKSLPYPILADPNRRLAVQLGMLDPKEKDGTGMPLTARCVSNACHPLHIWNATSGQYEKILRVVFG
uniref:Peroxiredoxin 6 n=1 Tax=Eptatretus burgeri TaxID=7764 RepID=A0A8C4QT48_EPTBU